MQINWSIFAVFLAPIATLLIGMWLQRIFERKPKLIAYYTHASAFAIKGDNPGTIHTHGIVIRNAGKKPATDVRVRHSYLPEHYNVFPAIEFSVQILINGGAEIVFPTLVPEEQVSISYLYFPPILYNQIHAGIRHSDGFAKEVTTLPTELYPIWLLRSLKVLLVIGGAATLYIIYELICLGLSLYDPVLK
ncbi:MAG: hypothetical protein AB7I96_06210 [Candidatus Dadabacteria bacterium]